jgi:DNA-binding transcriptional LysR family regulator
MISLPVRGELTTVLDDWPATGTSVYALYPSKKHMSAKVKAFLEFVVEQLSSR